MDSNARSDLIVDLRDFSPGDGIAIARQDGSTARFRVAHVGSFDEDALPTKAANERRSRRDEILRRATRR